MPSVPPPDTIPSDRVSAAPPRAVDEPPWQPWTAPAAVVVGAGIGLVASAIVAIAAQAGGSSISHPTPAVSIITNVAFDLSFVAAAIYFASLHGRPAPADFGLRRVRLTLAVAAVVVAYPAYYAVTAVYALIFHLHGSDKLPRELGVGKSTAALVGTAVFVCVVAPIAEEFFFRGFIFGALRRWRIVVGGRNVGVWVAAALTGVLFGFAHTGSAASQFLIPLGFLGFVLCLVRWRTGSLYPCMALHSLNNSLALGVNQHWSAGEILALLSGSILVIAAVTGPLGARWPAVA
jgi:membrane protease YdiL (CAAX protease family)